MLGKLMKYELRATSRLLVPLYIALFSLSVINHFMMNYGSEEGVFALITALLFMVQSLFTMAIVTATVLFMIMRFYKNLLSDEGYLMMTLPVSTHQLILSKLLVTLFWVIISAIGAAVSWIIVIGPFNEIGSIGFTREIIASIVRGLNDIFGPNWMAGFFQLIVIGILFLIGNILLVYVSIAVGQLFKRYKIIASIVSYVIISTVSQFLGILAMIGSGYVLAESSALMEITPNTILPILIIVGLIGCGIFYTATNYIFSRKLNLE